MIMCAMAIFAFAACSDKGDGKLDKIVGEWHYAATESGVEVEVYIGFSANYTFELYQKLGDGPHYRYAGKFTFDGEVLSGTYNDYTPWAHDYKVTKSGNTLELASTTDPDYTVKYTRKAIPEDVKTHYMPVTKADGAVTPIL